MEDHGLSRDRDTCHRLALDHVLALIADAEWSSQLVLRGSMLMTAYAGSAARKPADLDFVVVQDGWPVEDLDPFPYVDDLASIQQWPETADGAGRADLWIDDEFDTGGLHPRVAPEGVSWIRAEQWEEASPYEDLRRRIEESPQVGSGIVLAARQFEEPGDWTYSGYAMAGSRVTVPWQLEGERDAAHELSGVVQLDFAMDEPMPWRPAWTRIPRLAGGFSALRAASPELSLAWKLMWLLEDSKGDGFSRGKDLYDAVVLAELTGLGTVKRVAGLDLAALRRRDVDGARVDWEAFLVDYPEVEGSVGEWKQRLMNALALL